MFVTSPMHVLQPKQTRLKIEETKKLLEKYNISLSQLPKMQSSDPSLPEGCVVGDVIKIEREDENSVKIYHRVVV